MRRITRGKRRNIQEKRAPAGVQERNGSGLGEWGAGNGEK